ncbi:MAG: RNA polymerase subunit sigma-24, partial [Gaiella sp.]
VALAGDPATGLALLETIEGLDGYHYLHGARADLLRRLDRPAEARHAYEHALRLTGNETERRFYGARLADLGIKGTA